MNTWQTTKQLQYLIRNETWDGSSPVFHSRSVVASASPSEEAVEKMIAPICAIRPGGATVDKEQYDLLEQEAIVSLGVTHAGDAFGEFMLLGGHRVGQNRSGGRGLLEIEEKLFDAIGLLSTDFGIVVHHIASSAATLREFAEQFFLVRDYLFRIIVTADRYYHPVVNLQNA